MSKKSYDEIENGYKSDCSYPSASKNDLDEHKTSNHKKLFSEHQKFGNRNKIKTVNSITHENDTSGTSLDEDLYGINDKYCKTLEDLKSRLCFLNLDKPLNASEGDTDLNESLCYNDIKSNNKKCDPKNDFEENDYLFDKQTSTPKINSPEMIINTRKNDKTRNNVFSRVIDKNITLNGKPVFIQVTPNAEKKKMSLVANSNDVKTLTILKPITTYSLTTISSSDFYKESNYGNPSNALDQYSNIKKKQTKNYPCANINIRSLKTSNQNTMQNFEKIPTKKTGSSFSTNKISSQHTDYTKIVNLPSSVESDYTSSENLNLKSSTTIISNNAKSKRLHKKRNKVVPIPVSRSTSDTSVSENTKKFENLFLKYYKDAQEVTSNPFSTPPPNVSTCASGSSTGTTPKSNTSSLVKQKLPIITTQPSIVYSTKPIYKSLDAFSPIYSSSLDVPRKHPEIASFPAISKITSFIHYPEKELNKLTNKYSTESNVAKMSALAKKIKHEMYFSSESIKQKSGFLKNDEQDKNQTTDNQSGNKSVQKQAKKFSFYDASSTDSKTDADEYMMVQSDLQSSSYSDDEQSSQCYCFCRWLFPKQRNKFFS